MGGADGGVRAAQHYLCARGDAAKVIYDFFDAGVPVCHYGLDEDGIEGGLEGEPTVESGLWDAEAVVFAGYTFKRLGFWDYLLEELASAEGVGMIFFDGGHEGALAVEKIKEGKIDRGAKRCGGGEHAVGLEPEIVGGEIVDGRVYEQDAHGLFSPGYEDGDKAQFKKNIKRAGKCEEGNKVRAGGYYSSSDDYEKDHISPALVYEANGEHTYFVEEEHYDWGLEGYAEGNEHGDHEGEVFCEGEGTDGAGEVILIEIYEELERYGSYENDAKECAGNEQDRACRGCDVDVAPFLRIEAC